MGFPMVVSAWLFKGTGLMPRDMSISGYNIGIDSYLASLLTATLTLDMSDLSRAVTTLCQIYPAGIAS